MQKTKLGGRFWLALTVFSLVGQVAWVVENMYFNVFIYKMFHATAAQISLMVAASAVVATLTTILIGAIRDRDTMEQHRVNVADLPAYLREYFAR